MSDIDKSKIKKKIDELYLKYNYDTNLINKLNSIIINDVENMLINFKNNQEYRENRKNFLIEGHDKFIKDFLANNLFYYYSSSEIFFRYNKVDFSICKEDDIIVEILKKYQNVLMTIMIVILIIIIKVLVTHYYHGNLKLRHLL